MINLLRPDAKHVIAKEYRARKFVVYLAVIFCLLSIAGILLFALYLSLQLETASLTREGSLFKQAATSTELAGYQKQIADATQTLKILKSNQPLEKPLTEIINAIVVGKPQGIKITSFDLSATESGTSGQIKGVYATRQDIINFAEFLRAANFGSINSPINNLIKETNGSYVISFEINATTSANQ